MCVCLGRARTSRCLGSAMVRAGRVEQGGELGEERATATADKVTGNSLFAESDRKRCILSALCLSLSNSLSLSVSLTY